MTTTEEKHPNDKKKRGRLAKREIRIPITQDSNKNNETPHYLHVKIQLLFRDVTP